MILYLDSDNMGIINRLRNRELIEVTEVVVIGYTPRLQYNRVVCETLILFNYVNNLVSS